MSSSTPSDLRHVYHLSWLRILPLPLLVAGLFLLFAFSLCPAAGSGISWIAYLGILGGILLFFSPFFLLLWQSRLVLSPEGIAHHQFGYTVRSTWDNIECVAMHRGAQALYLTKPGTSSFLLRISAAFVGAAKPGAAGMIGDPQRLGEGRLILLAPFMCHWKKGPLREDIRRWAPQLFDERGELKATV